MGAAGPPGGGKSAEIRRAGRIYEDKKMGSDMSTYIRSLQKYFATIFCNIHTFLVNVNAAAQPHTLRSAAYEMCACLFP